MVFIGARLRRGVHLTGGSTELRGIDSALHLKLLQGIDRGQYDIRVEVHVCVVDAIQGVVVKFPPLPGNGKLLVGAASALA